MPQKQHDPQRGGCGPGLGDIRGQRVTEASLPHIADLKQEAVQRLRRMRLVERVHNLGPRIAFELLDELDRHHGIGADLDRRLARYAGLDPEILRAVGGDRFPRLPIRIVGGRP